MFPRLVYCTTSWCLTVLFQDGVQNSARAKVKQSTSTQLVNHTVSPKPRMWPVWLSDCVSWIGEEWGSFISFCCRTERVGDYQRCPDCSWIWISFNVYLARVERIVFVYFLFMALLDTVQKASMGSLNSGTHWLLCQCSTHLHQSREFILFILVNHLMTTPGSV